jgi:transposase-like protein
MEIGANSKRKSYTLNEKIDAMKRLKELNGNVSKASRQLEISRKNIRRWRDNEGKLANANKQRSRRRLGGGGRKCFWPELESRLFEWFKVERIDNRNVVNYRRLREKAKEIALELKITDFIGSDHWIFGFNSRHRLTNRKITHVGQEDNRSPEEKMQTAIDHLNTTQMMTTNMTADLIFNMDEVPVYIDMLSSQTISFKGEKTTEANTTGHTKTRLTVVLLVSAAGEQLKTMVILRGLKKVPNIKVPSNIYLCVTQKGSMNSYLMIDWIKNCFIRRAIFSRAKPSLLFMDEFGSHKKEEVLELLKVHKSITKFIPPKTTHYLQPLDVGINSSFKTSLKFHWGKWFSEGKKEWTPKGYRKRPSWETVLEIVSKSVKEIKKETITKSFESCGIAENGRRVESEKLNHKLQSILLKQLNEQTEQDECESNDENVEDDDEIEIDESLDESGTEIESDDAGID